MGAGGQLVGSVFSTALGPGGRQTVQIAGPLQATLVGRGSRWQTGLRWTLPYAIATHHQSSSCHGCRLSLVSPSIIKREESWLHGSVARPRRERVDDVAVDASSPFLDRADIHFTVLLAAA